MSYVPPVVVLSDLHCGSTVALCPPDAPRTDGGTVGLNAVQRDIWVCWRHFVEVKLPAMLDKRRPVLVLNGDLIDGNHHRITQINDNDTSFHAAAALEVLRDLCEQINPVRVLVTRGTQCHVGSAENSIGKELGADLHPISKTYAPYQWKWKQNGVLLSATHHMTSTKRKWLEASALGIELAAEQMECCRKGLEAPRVIMRGHRHVGGHYTDGHALAVCTPAWQVSTDYGHKYVPGAVPTIGAYLLDFAGRDFGQPPNAHALTYPVESLEHTMEIENVTAESVGK